MLSIRTLHNLIASNRILLLPSIMWLWWDPSKKVCTVWCYGRDTYATPGMWTVGCYALLLIQRHCVAVYTDFHHPCIGLSLGSTTKTSSFPWLVRPKMRALWCNWWNLLCDCSRGAQKILWESRKSNSYSLPYKSARMKRCLSGLKTTSRGIMPKQVMFMHSILALAIYWLAEKKCFKRYVRTPLSIKTKNREFFFLKTLCSLECHSSLSRNSFYGQSVNLQGQFFWRHCKI